MSYNKHDQEAEVSRHNFVVRLPELFNEALETNWKFPEPEAEFTTEKEKTESCRGQQNGRRSDLTVSLAIADTSFAAQDSAVLEIGDR